ncbi:hypothetical protein GPJ56_000833 [Histomonas meleagridis]|uniref:uncharacterized protein n=1 Tax=Histomonas meleagridis TaxID=135588 RepID=UPI00355A8150|nr:hypothetical protein GPJ56_000833 [Histomonas meleagridis]KAH0804409.1 hypothetical protein GO595_003239 [Histomonas meleagridis]
MSDTSSSTSEEEKEGEEINTEQSEYEDDEKTTPLPSLLVDVVPDPRDVEEDILLPYFTKKINGLKPKKSQKPPEPKK